MSTPAWAAEAALGSVGLLILLCVSLLAGHRGRRQELSSASVSELHRRLSVLEERVGTMPQQTDLRTLSERIGSVEMLMSGLREQLHGTANGVMRIERQLEKLSDHWHAAERSRVEAAQRESEQLRAAQDRRGG